MNARRVMVVHVVPRGEGSGMLNGLDLAALSKGERAQLALLCAKARANALRHRWWDEARAYAVDLSIIRGAAG